MKIALAQINPVVGDIKGNSEVILSVCREGARKGANLIATPELSLWGYPPRDLLLNPLLLEEQRKTLDEVVVRISQDTPDLSLLIGIAEPAPDLQLPKLFNSIVLINNNGWEIVARKQLLPSYDVFDERRYFRPAKKTGMFKLKVGKQSWKIGLTICEDLWVEDKIQRQRIKGPDPIKELIHSKIDLLINLSASPYSHKKEFLREKLAIKAADRLKCPVVYLNQIGGNDELVFDGASFVIDKKGDLILSLPRCKEHIEIWEPNEPQKTITRYSPQPQEMLLEMLVLGVRDYAKKCRFKSALIGLSGGIDSTLVAIIASAALGRKNVYGVLMPSPFTSDSSTQDALALAKRLGIQTKTIPIKSLMKTYEKAFEEALGEPPKELTAENLQARIRGTILMAIANQKKHLLLSTGNKSELAVGYCTLYGDMNGGLSVIGDLYKTSVFELCNWLDSKEAKNHLKLMGLPTGKELVGLSIRTKPPSAELKPGQLDSDYLPEYEILDPILKALIEERRNPHELIKEGFEQALLAKVQQLLKESEFKRRQAPPMIKVSNQAFGSGWRLPIATSSSQ